MICRLVERLQRSQMADQIVIATTTNRQDDVLATACGGLNVSFYRGSEHDVLGRYAEAACEYLANTVVRITADCPLIDSGLVDSMIRSFHEAKVDYLSNSHPPTWPYGMAVEVFSAAVLAEASKNALDPVEREHVTPYIYRRPTRFTTLNIENSTDWSHYRWTVDTREDYELVRRLFETAFEVRPDFTFNDVLSIAHDHPDWLDINKHIEQVKV